MSDKLRFYTAEQLGPTRSLTPEGFLLCENVPLARTGVLIYAKGEVPIDADDDGLIRIIRDPADVFSPTAVASFAGKPVCNDHPSEKVTPDSWKKYTVGVVLNPHRGDGAKFDDDFLYGDLLITDRDAINDVLEGKREVSAGYDADYEQLRPGEGRQHLIIGNHVALVDKGRCGPRCAIGDSAMAVVTKDAWKTSFDAILRAHFAGDSQVLVDELEKVGDMLGKVWDGKTQPPTEHFPSKDGVHVHLHQSKDDDGDGDEDDDDHGKRIEALERAVAIMARGHEAHDSDEEEKEEKKTDDKRRSMRDEDEEEKKEEKKDTEDKATTDEDEEDDEDEKEKSESKDSKTTTDKAMVGDSTSMEGSWQELISRAEFLAPGIKMPTFDRKAPAKTTFDAMCSFRRKVLTEAMKEDDTKAAVEQMSGGKPNLLQMTCDSVALLFNGASELVRQNNKRGVVHDGARLATANASLAATVKSINERNRTRFGIAG